MANVKLAAVRGMNDLLPAHAPLWEWFEARVTDWVRSYGYQQIRTPVLEHTDLFVRGIGEVTDIVEKEMYSFEDRANQERLTLRPEFTAGTVRAAIEHSLTYDGPKRVWSMGPLFRHERPQRGRFRQFHQVNVEALGLRGARYRRRADRDAGAAVENSGHHERALGNQLPGAGRGARVSIAPLWSPTSSNMQTSSMPTRMRRLISNPLRILDSKNPAMANLLSDAPQITAYLGEASQPTF